MFVGEEKKIVYVQVNVYRQAWTYLYEEIY